MVKTFTALPFESLSPLCPRLFGSPIVLPLNPQDTFLRPPPALRLVKLWEYMVSQIFFLVLNRLVYPTVVFYAFLEGTLGPGCFSAIRSGEFFPSLLAPPSPSQYSHPVGLCLSEPTIPGGLGRTFTFRFFKGLVTPLRLSPFVFPLAVLFFFFSALLPFCVLHFFGKLDFVFCRI